VNDIPSIPNAVFEPMPSRRGLRRSAPRARLKFPAYPYTPFASVPCSAPSLCKSLLKIGVSYTLTLLRRKLLEYVGVLTSQLLLNQALDNTLQ